MRRTFILFFLCTTFALSGTAFGGNSQSPEVRISNNDNENYAAQTVYNSVHQEYFVVWHVSSFQGRYVMGRRLDLYGNLLDEYTIAFEDSPPRDNAQPTVAYDPVNDRYLVAWLHDTPGDGSNWDILGRFVPWDGPTPSLNGFNICNFSSQQWNPRAAYAGTQQEFLVTWWNEGTGGVASYVSAARIAPADGSVLSTFVVASGTEERTVPDVAYNLARNEYLIVYQLMDAAGGNIAAVRMNAGGSILGGGEFDIAGWADPETHPRVAASRIDNQWLVVWQSDHGSEPAKDVYGRRVWVDGSGTIQQSAPVRLAATTIDEGNPEVAVFPESTVFAVSWEQQYSSSTGNFGISAQTIDTADRLGEKTVIQTVYTSENIDSSNPAMAAGPQGFMIAWVQERDSSTAIDISGRVMWRLFSEGFESGDLSRWSDIYP